MKQAANKRIFDFFKKTINNQRLAHGYLFYGPEDDLINERKKDMAFWLAGLLKISSFDILYITAEQEKKDISIEQIRKLKKHLSLSPYNSLYKLAIIDRAETMNKESANAILKTLEEPQRDTILILITSKPSLLPKTIISRLQEIKFNFDSLNQLSDNFINKKYIDILKKPLNSIFEYIENIYKQEAEIFLLLNSWLFLYRKLMIKNESYLYSVKEIIKTKDIISNTNTNKRLALENLVLRLK